jgi:acetyl/propionyl-CoA carboxylase alpha subunit
MKVFNEIKAEVSGRITKVLVKNAEAVEYDQPLFVVEACLVRLESEHRAVTPRSRDWPALDTLPHH